MPGSLGRLSALLLTLGVSLLQGAHNTTMIPSCLPGESNDNCTALEHHPRMAQEVITKCDEDMKGYCFHGECFYVLDMRKESCRCEVGYTGSRCEHIILTVKKPLSKEYVVLTIFLVILLLIIVAGSTYYFLRWYKSKKSKESNKAYERVTLNDENNSTLLQV